jgi:uncharacterized protein (TIGR03032 family)
MTLATLAATGGCVSVAISLHCKVAGRELLAAWLLLQTLLWSLTIVCKLTGRLDAHDVGLASDGCAFFVSSLYNCIATPARQHSFRPVWRPNFVSALVAEDRCHLNGLAVDDTGPVFATAVAETDEYRGWRESMSSGGLVIDIRTDRVVCAGLSMPHSPRLHDGRLWVLQSGKGEIGTVDPDRASVFTPAAREPR